MVEATQKKVLKDLTTLLEKCCRYRDKDENLENVDTTYEGMPLGGWCIIDDTTGWCIVPLKPWVALLIKTLYDVPGAQISKTPIFGGSKPELINNLAESCYSGGYLRLILEVAKHYYKVKFVMGTNFPLTVETEDFKVIIAPQVER